MPARACMRSCCFLLREAAPRRCATVRPDLALIPVAAIPGISDLRIVTPYCIGASGPVRTVVLASADPLENVDTVYLDSHSLTSVRLVRLLAAKLWKREFRWRELDDFSVLDDPNPRTGYVIIGDKVFAREAAFRYRYDLAEQWRLLTGRLSCSRPWVARRRRAGGYGRLADRSAGLRHGPYRRSDPPLRVRRPSVCARLSDPEYRFRFRRAEASGDGALLGGGTPHRASDQSRLNFPLKARAGKGKPSPIAHF